MPRISPSGLSLVVAPGWDALPEALRQGIFRLAAHQHRERENSGAAPQPPAAVAALWQPWRQDAARMIEARLDRPAADSLAVSTCRARQQRLAEAAIASRRQTLQAILPAGATPACSGPCSQRTEHMEIALRAALIAWLARTTPLLARRTQRHRRGSTFAHEPAMARDWPPAPALTGAARANEGREVRVALELHCRGDTPDTAADSDRGNRKSRRNRFLPHNLVLQS